MSYVVRGGTLYVEPELTRCEQEALALGIAGPFETIIEGTEGSDTIEASLLWDERDLICGFGGGDTLTWVSILGTGDAFIGGEGNDVVSDLDGGTFYGGPGDDRVDTMHTGTFYGGEGNDIVGFMSSGWFNGGDGTDTVIDNFGGRLDGVEQGT